MFMEASAGERTVAGPKRKDTFRGRGWPQRCPREDRAGLPSSLSFLPWEPPRSLGAIPTGCPALTQWATEWCVLCGVSPCLPPRRRFLLPVPVCRVLPELWRVALLSPSPRGKTESLASQTEGGRRGFPVHFSRFPEQGTEARGCRTARARADGSGSGAGAGGVRVVGRVVLLCLRGCGSRLVLQKLSLGFHGCPLSVVCHTRHSSRFSDCISTNRGSSLTCFVCRRKSRAHFPFSLPPPAAYLMIITGTKQLGPTVLT